MSDQMDDAARRREEARQEVEEARAEAAALIVQRDATGESETGAAEERLVDAVEEAATESDPRRVERLADEAGKARDDIKRQLHGPAGAPDEGEAR